LSKRTRWTILDVDESIIKAVKKFANDNGFTTARALKELITKALNATK
jgi:predicted methyltransferase